MHDHHHGTADTSRQRLWLAFIVNLIFLVIEVIGGLYANSLALLSDAGHMLTDVGALGLAIWVSSLATGKRDSKRTFGYFRAEIIGAFVNGATLILICGFILYEAWRRIGDTTPILGGPLLIIAVLGFLANGISAWILSSHRKVNLNIEGAYLHLIFDALGSIGAIVSGIVILIWDFYFIDIIASVLIVILIFIGTKGLIKNSINLLMDGVPTNLDYHQIESALLNLDHVEKIHDLHIWSISQNKPALSAHLKMSRECTQSTHWSDCLKYARQMLARDFNIEHVTLQIEPLHFIEGKHCG
ncbi:MAG: cation transporter [FCB group bacterium]|nr:cation transporter [FCB group bacterium]